MKTRKILAILLTIVLMMGLLCTSAFATTYATGIAVYVYKSANDYTVYELGNLTQGATALNAFQQADSTSAATYTTATNGSWLYTINGNLASYSASDYTVQNNDFLAFYLVPDYTEDTIIAPSYFTEWLIDGVIQSVTTTHTLGNDLGMETGLNYAHPTVNYISASSIYLAKSANSPLTAIDGFLFISGSANDHNVLTTCYPVKLRSMDTTWVSVMRSQAANLKAITDDILSAEIGTTAKNNLDNLAQAAVSAPPYPQILMTRFINFEDVFAALAYNVDARLNFVSFTDDLAVTSPFFPYYNAYTVQSSTADPTAVPTNFSMTVVPMDTANATVAVTIVETSQTITPSGGVYPITLPANATSTIRVTITNGTVIKVYNFSVTTPAASTSPNGSTPTAVVSYLPIGQYANYTTTWGTSSGKFTNGYASTGVSLGALGGYIEFYFDNGITDDPRNPYGVDLVVYGNAFDGNPEAGAVQVSENGTVWYELAGSRYYDEGFNYSGTQIQNKFSKAYTGTLRDASVTYGLNGGTINASLLDHDNNAKFSNVLFSTMNTNPSTWWPSSSSFPMGDSYTDNVDTSHVATVPHTDSNVTINFGSTTLGFGGVTAVQDSDTTAFYAFGYADVTPNGNPATYGDAVNPYVAYTYGKTGGDGFDLEWAVDIYTGLPINVTGKTFHYVRVYSAVLDNGTFNETSTEVCGIFTAYRETTETSSVGRTDDPTIYIDNSGLSLADYVVLGMITPTTAGNVTIYDATGLVSGTISASGASGTNIWVNNDANSHTVVSGENTVRVIAQLGNAAPSISLIKF